MLPFAQAMANEAVPRLCLAEAGALCGAWLAAKNGDT
jgi:hypothetical protein